LAIQSGIPSEESVLVYAIYSGYIGHASYDQSLSILVQYYRYT